MKNIYREILSGIQTIAEESKTIEAQKESSEQRARRFIEERKAESESQKRIDAMRESIRRK